MPVNDSVPSVPSVPAFLLLKSLPKVENDIYERCILPIGHASMSETGIAKLFKHGRSQAVRLPLAFRLPGDRVRVRRVGHGILLEPIVTDIDAWFAELDRFGEVPFMEEGRRQPPMPEAEDRF